MSRLPPFDPETLPVIVAGDPLPAVPPDRLTASALRERLASQPVWAPEFLAERPMMAREPAHASVLVPLVVRDELTVLLTRRTSHLRDHGGQIAFPGGRAESFDADVRATALREAQEEVGLAPGEVEVIGCLPEYRTVTQFVVTPVVALVRPGYTLQPDPFEVDEVFEVPLAFVMDPANHQRRRAVIDGLQREFFSMPWRPDSGDGVPRHYFIWGATAAMLRNFYRLLMA